MTRAQIERSLRRWQRLLGLEAWEIHLDTETRPSTESAVMEIDRSQDYRQVHPDAFALIEQRFEHELERAVENLAKAFEGTLHAAP